MIEDEQGFPYLHIEVSMCIDCSLCESACPVINQDDTRESTSAFAAMNKNEYIQKTHPQVEFSSHWQSP